MKAVLVLTLEDFVTLVILAICLLSWMVYLAIDELKGRRKK